MSGKGHSVKRYRTNECIECGRRLEPSARSSSCRECTKAPKRRYDQSTVSPRFERRTPTYHRHATPPFQPSEHSMHRQRAGQYIPPAGGFPRPRGVGQFSRQPSYPRNVPILQPLSNDALAALGVRLPLGTRLQRRDAPIQTLQKILPQVSADTKKRKRIVPGTSLSKMPKVADDDSESVPDTNKMPKVAKNETDFLPDTKAKTTASEPQAEVINLMTAEELSTTDESDASSWHEDEEGSKSAPLCRFKRLGLIVFKMNKKSQPSTSTVSCQTHVATMDSGTQYQSIPMTTASTQVDPPQLATSSSQTNELPTKHFTAQAQQTEVQQHSDAGCQTTAVPRAHPQRPSSPEVIILDGPEQPLPKAPPPRKFAPRRAFSDRQGTSSTPIDVTSEETPPSSRTTTAPEGVRSTASTHTKHGKNGRRLSEVEAQRERAYVFLHYLIFILVHRKEQERLQSEQERLLNAARMRFMADLNVPPPPHWRSSDPYAVLGVHSSASLSSCRKAWRAMALKYHPDKCNLSYAREAFDSCARAWKTIEENSRLSNSNDTDFQPL